METGSLHMWVVPVPGDGCPRSRVWEALPDLCSHSGFRRLRSLRGLSEAHGARVCENRSHTVWSRKSTSSGRSRDALKTCLPSMPRSNALVELHARRS